MQRLFRRTLSVVLALVLLASVLVPGMIPKAEALSYTGSASYRSGRFYRNLTQVRLTGNPRTDIVNIAKSQVGYQEGSSASQLSGEVFGGGNCTEYGSWYGFQDMWCAMFVSWCADLAGVSRSVIPNHAYTPDGLRWFRNRGLAYSRAAVEAGEYTPRAGDLIYFKSGRNQNTTNHVGIVTGYANGVIYSIEGNTSADSVSTNGGTVAHKSYPISNTYIVYICSPDYQMGSASAGAVMPPSQKENGMPEDVSLAPNRGNPTFNATVFQSTVVIPTDPSWNIRGSYARAGGQPMAFRADYSCGTFAQVWCAARRSPGSLCVSSGLCKTQDVCWTACRSDGEAWQWYQAAASGR